MASSTTTIMKTSVILRESADWDEWILIINAMAKRGDVSEYVNLTAANEPAEPVRPAIPTFLMIEPDAASLGDLDETQQKELSMLREDFKEISRTYREKRDALKDIEQHILTTVDRQNILYLDGADTVYQKLVALKKRLAPTDRARTLEVTRRYRELLRGPRAQQQEAWLQQYERTYAEAVKTKLPEVQGDRPLHDFFDALRSTDMAYVSGREAVLADRIERKDVPPSVKDLLENYRNHLRTTKARMSASKGSSHTAFATLQGTPQENPESEQGPRQNRSPNPKKLSDCLCGESHRFKDCAYLIEELRGTGWAPNEEIKRQIDDKLSKIPKLRIAVEKAQKQVKEKAPTMKKITPVGAFAVESFSYKLKNCWTLDSGTDVHVCNDRARFKFERAATEQDVLVAGKTTYEIEAFGSVEITAKGPSGPVLIQLLNVALAPGFLTNLACLRRFTEKGVHWDTQKGRLHRNGQTFCYTQSVDDHWVLEYGAPDAPESTYAAFASSREPRSTLKATATEWHRILGHPGPDTIAHLEKAVDNVRVTGTAPSTIECETCAQSKARQVVSRRAGQEEPAGEPLERVGYDLIPVEPAYNRDKWVSHFRCFQTGADFVYTHPRKNDAVAVIKEFLNMAKTRYGATTRFIRTDDEPTLGKKYEDLLADQGITAERTAPYTSAQNGRTERAGGVLTLRARALRIAAELPANLWPETYTAAGYLNNRTPKEGIEWTTPIEALTKQKPQLAHLHPYGCRAYPLRSNVPRLDKLAPRAMIGYLVGYDSSNIYRIWVPSQMRVIRTRDVTFDHSRFYDPAELDIGHSSAVSIEDIIEVLDMPAPSYSSSRDITEEDDLNDTIEVYSGPVGTAVAEEAREEEELSEEEPVQQMATPDPTPDRKTGHSTESAAETHAIRSAARQPTEVPPDAVAMGTRSRRRQAYIAALSRAAELTPYYSAFSAGLQKTEIDTQNERLHRDTLPPEPRHWRQMLKHRFAREFEHAAIRELNELERRGTYELTQKKEQKTVPLTWVFKYKFDSDGYLIKFKARLCVRGDLQSTEQDTYAATLAARTFRALIAMAAAFDLELWQYDAVNAFINSCVDEEIFCECPDGFQQPGQCWQLRKALYGLKQAPMLWYKELSTALEDLGLWPVPGVNCLYTNGWLILFFYVDDIVALCTKSNVAKLREFETRLLKKFEMRALGELQWFLGIRILRNRSERKIWLCQDSYICKIATRFGLAGSPKGLKTPLPFDGLPCGTAGEEVNQQRVYAYQQRVGSLNFAAVISRPDIAYTTSNLSQFLRNPTPGHIAAADRAISYLYDTRTFAVEYSGRASISDIFLCSSDAAFADNQLTRHSSDGYLFQLYGGAIDWRAAKQNTVTTSSTEAELLALSRAAKEAIWWRRFFESVQFDTTEKLKIRCDNRQTIRILTKDLPKLDTKLRHVDIHQHWLRQEVQAGRIEIEWMPTAEMPADGLTKQLPRQKHEEFVRQLNLVDISDQLSRGPNRK
jgi:Reverse transcriptase (RNA-dependent DNA polymerase)